MSIDAAYARAIGPAAALGGAVERRRWTYRRAGFRDCGETKGGLLALRLAPEDMPDAVEPRPMGMAGTPLFDPEAA